MIELIQTILLVILVERSLLLRNRYKFAIEFNMPGRDIRGYFALWIYCQQKDAQNYWRLGGKRIFGFYFGQCR